MRVLQVIGAMDRAGAETVIMNLYRCADRDRIQFDFLVHEERECDYDREIVSLGGRIYRLPRFNVLNARGYRMACRRHFAEHPEHVVVHGHIGSCASIYLGEAKRAGRATILHSHAQQYEGFPKDQVFKALVAPSLKVADEFLACSPEAGLDRFGPGIVSGNHYHIMPNGVDVDKYRCTEEEHLAAKQYLGLRDNFIVGHVGRLIEVKNHRFLFRTFKCILDEIPHARLLLLGRGELEDHLRQEASALGIEGKILFCGVRDDVPDYLKAFDLFLFPSIKEGLPMATVEAQAAGVRCVLSSGVPQAAIASRVTKRLDLECGPDTWAKEALKLMDVPFLREDGAADVKTAGYDIRDTASWLSRLYCALAYEA